jgi:hypothetical protein
MREKTVCLMNPFEVLKYNRHESHRHHNSESNHHIVEIAVVIKVVICGQKHDIHHYHFPHLKPAEKHLIRLNQRWNAQKEVNQKNLAVYIASYVMNGKAPDDEEDDGQVAGRDKPIDPALLQGFFL